MEIRRTLHIDEEDYPLVDDDLASHLLENKLIIRFNTDERKKIEEIFTWLKENCKSHYMVRGPMSAATPWSSSFLDVELADFKLYIYFSKQEEATQFGVLFIGNEGK